MALKTLFFDLDGTITDSQAGIINSIRYSEQKLQLPAHSAEQLQLFIGPPLLESYEKYFGLTPAQAQTALLAYREYYAKQGIFENQVYAQIPETLAQLKQAGLQIMLVTSKPENYAEQIITHFNLASYFDHIYGASFDEKRAAKTEIIAYALASEQLTTPGTIAMVGDRENDINGAHDHQLHSIAVRYGFGSDAELQAAHPSITIDQPAELLQAVAHFA